MGQYLENERYFLELSIDGWIDRKQWSAFPGSRAPFRWPCQRVLLCSKPIIVISAIKKKLFFTHVRNITLKGLVAVIMDIHGCNRPAFDWLWGVPMSYQVIYLLYIEFPSTYVKIAIYSFFLLGHMWLPWFALETPMTLFLGLVVVIKDVVHLSYKVFTLFGKWWCLCLIRLILFVCIGETFF